ncbi:MAG: hypothetical protein ACRDFX_02730 [Chloroflexota bacterium]
MRPLLSPVTGAYARSPFLHLEENYNKHVLDLEEHGAKRVKARASVSLNRYMCSQRGLAPVRANRSVHRHA